jgi:hypothetical protein
MITHMFTQIVYLEIFIRMLTRMCIHMFTHTFTNMFTHMFTDVYTHVYTHIYTHVNTHYIYTHFFTEFSTHAYRHSNTHVYTYDGMQVEIAMQKLSNLIHFLLLITVLIVTFIHMGIIGISHSSRLSFFYPIEEVHMGLNYLIRL